MRAVILAGGLGTRLSEETILKPKPMVEIGDRPMIWHIMKVYSEYGINEFIICCGYKGYIIKDYFQSYSLQNSDLTISTRDRTVSVHREAAENWTVTLVDTGHATMTGGRLKRLQPFLKDDETFCFTYGDGVSDLDVKALVSFHKSHGRLATLTAVRPSGRYGVLEFGKENLVRSFKEKPEGESSWINGGFFVLNSSVLERIEGDDTVWEEGPLSSLAREDQLAAFRHDGFWQPMDTLRDKHLLNDLWMRDCAPWKKW